MDKKAQSAKEFIVTYGWVILIVLIAIIILTYLGFSPSILPERCYLPEGLNCKSLLVTTDSVQLIFENTIGKNITIKKINISKITGCVSSANKTIPNNEKAIFYVNCTLKSGDVLNSELIITYDEIDGLSGIKRIGIITKKIE